MKITEDRFKSILAGTATNLTSKEILIRQEAFDAERRGQDPMLVVEANMPDVTIVRGAATGAIPPLEVLPENARRKNSVASGVGAAPRPAGSVKNVKTFSDPDIDRSERLKVRLFWAIYALVAATTVLVALSWGKGPLLGQLTFKAIVGLALCLILPPLLRILSPVFQVFGSLVWQLAPWVVGTFGFLTILHLLDLL